MNSIKSALEANLGLILGSLVGLLVLAILVPIFICCCGQKCKEWSMARLFKVDVNETYYDVEEEEEVAEVEDANLYYGQAVDGWEGERVTDFNENYG